ncbi:unnamed protein product [Oreochromis niloticus]|nr:unnamed protein product [Mustela putorius furo]
MMQQHQAVFLLPPPQQHNPPVLQQHQAVFLLPPPQQHNKFGVLLNFHNLQKEELLQQCQTLSTTLTHDSQPDINGTELAMEMQNFPPLPSKNMTNMELLTFLHEKKLAEIYPNMWVALRIFATLPVTVAAAERSFSKLKLIKTYLRSTMMQEHQEMITAESGQDVTLQCRVRHSNITILVLEWKRADLGDEYVLLYHDGYFVPQVQHPSFKNRVDLQDRQMKDGDVSLILKDVTINDTGTYECRALVLESLSREVNIISLNVVPPGQTGGSVGLIVGLSVTAVLLVASVFSFFDLQKTVLRFKQASC